MFCRLLWRMVSGNRGRLMVALVAVVSGAAVVSALLNLQSDIEHKLTQEFRVLGSNVVIAAAQGPRTGNPAASGISLNAPDLIDEDAALAAVDRSRTTELEAAAPFFYFVARTQGTPVVVAGTWLDQLRAMNPSWKITGDWVAGRGDRTRCVVGSDVARQMNLAPGRTVDLTYADRSLHLTVAGIADTGGTEDSQIFVDEANAQNLSGLNGRITAVQLNVRGTMDEIAAYASRLAAALPGDDVHPVRDVTDAAASLLARIRLLIVAMVALILVLTALCVLATMAALAMERRVDVGLMKALGGPISRIVALFLAEVGVLGAVGGVVGCLAGVVLSRWMGQHVFGASIAPRWDVMPVTVGLMIAVSLAGALPLRLLGRVKPAVILREE
jgi:putative ABC transport system permease protein